MTLHDRGYVHRDINPRTVLWLSYARRWTVVHFGCAAQLRSTSPIGCSLYYAAPEVLAALQDDKHDMHVTEALDAWSVGTVALEMVLGANPFGSLESAGTVRPPKVQHSPTRAENNRH